MKSVSKKICVAFLCGILAIVGCLCLQLDVGVVLAESPQLTQDVEFSGVYVLGSKLTVPESSISIGNKTYEAEAIVHYPNGEAYSRSEITLSAVGEYTVEYRAITDQGLVAVEKIFSVSQEAYQVTGTRSAVSYGTVENAESRPGVVASLAEGERLLFNHIIDISNNTRNDIIAELFVNPTQFGISDALNVSFVLTDIYDSDNYITVTNKRLDRTPWEFRWQEASFATANAVGQPATGLEVHAEGTFIWEGGTYKLHQNNIYGAGVNFYMGGIPKINGDCSDIGDPTDIAEQSLQLSMDYASRRVYLNDRVIADLDDVTIFKSTLWNGFTTGKCLLSVYATAYNEDLFNCVITKVGGLTGEELAQKLITDNEKPNIELVYGPYEDVGFPSAIAGKSYPLPEVMVTDNLDDDVALVAKVYKNYGTKNQINIAVVNGEFVPPYKGQYMIVYTAIDDFGNSSTLEYKVTAIDDAEDLSLRLSKEMPLSTVGKLITLPEGIIENAQGFTSLKVTAYFQEEDISVDIPLQGEEAYCFRPLYAGEWQIIYEYSDYIQTKTEEFALSVSPSSDPFIYTEAALPKYLIRGAAYELPVVSGYLFDTGKPVEKAADVFIKDDDGAERKTEGQHFVTYADEYATIIYRLVNGDRVDEKQYVIPVKDVGYDGLKIRMADYFAGENFNITAESDRIRLETEQTGAQSFTFIQPLQVFDFETLFHVSSRSNGFDTINVYLTDSVQPDITVKASYIRNRAGNTIFRVNDTGGYVSSGDFVESSVDNFRLVYNNADKTISPSLDYGVTVLKDLNGNDFNGFPSGKVYLRMELANVVGRAGVEVISINNQPMSSVAYDLLRPEISMSPVTGEKNIGEEVLISATYAADVLDPDIEFKMQVTAPSGDYVVSKDGIVLDSTADPSRDYIVVATEYGTYNVSYECVDAYGNRALYSYVFLVVDTTPPTVTLGESKTEYAVGETVVIADVKAEDNYTDCTVLIKVESANGSFFDLKDKSFVASLPGVYTVYYLVYDTNYNLTAVSYDITVK